MSIFNKNDENHWNDKWPKAPIIYSGRALRSKKERIGADVKNFITTNDALLNDIINKYGLKRRSYDETAWAVQKWVVKFLTYKYDDEQNKCPEFWQFPFETIQSQIGDCEDGAILITSLLINAGVPSYKCKVAAGYVQSAPTAPQGGHAYAIYLDESNSWKILDWCYFQDSHVPVDRKPLASNGGYKGCYKDVWFTFNNQYSWNQTSLKLEGRISNHQEAKKENVLIESISIDEIMRSVDEVMKEIKGEDILKDEIRRIR